MSAAARLTAFWLVAGCILSGKGSAQDIRRSHPPETALFATEVYAGPGWRSLGTVTEDRLLGWLSGATSIYWLTRHEIEGSAQVDWRNSPSLAERLDQARSAGAELALRSELAFVQTRHNLKAVGLRITVYDVRSGDPVAASAAIGHSPVDAHRALDNAVLTGIRRLVYGARPISVIFTDKNPPENVPVSLDRGSRDGIRAGDLFRVVRNGLPVAVVKAKRVHENDAQAEIKQLQPGGIRPGDRVRHIARIPPLPSPWFDEDRFRPGVWD